MAVKTLAVTAIAVIVRIPVPGTDIYIVISIPVSVSSFTKGKINPVRIQDCFDTMSTFSDTKTEVVRIQTKPESTAAFAEVDISFAGIDAEIDIAALLPLWCPIFRPPKKLFMMTDKSNPPPP